MTSAAKDGPESAAKRKGVPASDSATMRLGVASVPTSSPLAALMSTGEAFRWRRCASSQPRSCWVGMASTR